MRTVKAFRDSGNEALLDALAAGGMPADAVEIYRGRNIVAKLPSEGINIKSYAVPGLIKGLIYGIFRMPKAKRAYANAARLEQLGIGTPAPLGMVLCKSFGRLGRSYYVCRQLEGWNEMRGAEQRPDFEPLSIAFATFILHLHSLGVFMKDMTPGNVLFRGYAGHYEFCLVDINRMKFNVHDPSRLLVNLGVALDSESGIAHLARDYAALAGLDADETENLARRRYNARWKKIRRKQRLKALLGIKPR